MSMRSFKKIKEKVHYFLLNRKLKNLKRSHQTCNYEKAKQIGILFDASKSENIEAVGSLSDSLRQKNKKVHLLGFVERDKQMKAIPYDYFTLKNVNWAYVPKQPRIDAFMETNYDLLINLSTEECLPLEYISALSKAKYRVGRYIDDKTYCYDLMISLGEHKNINSFIDQINHYLNLIK